MHLLSIRLRAFLYLIKWMAKLLNADWSMKRVFFLNFACEEGKITRSRLVLRLLSNSLCYREVVENTSDINP